MARIEEGGMMTADGDAKRATTMTDVAADEGRQFVRCLARADRIVAPREPRAGVLFSDAGPDRFRLMKKP
jgi:hypothetical protein